MTAEFDTRRLRKLAIAARDVLVASGAVPRTYLATFSPAVVLSLLDRIEELEEQLGSLRAEHLGCLIGGARQDE